jgi:hypothetical protein
MMMASLGAFLLYVPLMPVAVIVAVLLCLVFMFLLGVQTGGRRIRISRMKNAWRSASLHLVKGRSIGHEWTRDSQNDINDRWPARKNG